MRDYPLETTFDLKFTTRKFTTGAPFALASGVISAYPNNSITQLTAGITLTADFDSVTGLNNVRVVATAANGYAAGSNYALVITTGTVDGVSVVGEVIGEFSLAAQTVGAVKTKTDFLPSATAGAAGGVFIAGSNAATTVASLTVTAGVSIANAAGVGLNITGGGSASGLRVEGGATGSGVFVQGGATSGKGMIISGIGLAGISIGGDGAGSGVEIFGGATGHALEIVGGSTSGDGINITTTSGDGIDASGATVGVPIRGNITGNLSGSVGSVTAFSAAAIQSIWDALTSALTTAGSIGKWILDKLDVVVSTRATPAQVNTEADMALADAGVTSARMGYVDNLNVGGNVASSAEATAIQNNTRVVRVVPEVIERPDSGTTTYRIELLLYDTAGNMEAPDSAPTIALVNQAGTDLIARLDFAGTMQLVSTGRYRSIYTASVGDTLEQLVWAFSVVEGGATRIYGNTTVIVDTTAVDFTAADRTKLDTLHDTRIPGVIQPQTGDSFARLGAPAGASTAADIAAIKVDTAAILVDTAEIGVGGAGLTALATQVSVNTIDDFLDTEVAAIKLKTDLIPAAPAAVGDIPTAVQNADTLLNRDMATGTDTGNNTTVRTVRQALRVLRNKWSISGTTQTFTKEDDVTTSHTAVLTGTAGADPVTASDANGP